MRRTSYLAGLALLSLLVAGGGANASGMKKAPTISAITATFLGTEAKATQYSVSVTTVPGNGTPTFSWRLKPPADDPTCDNFKALTSNHDNPNQSIWHHADVSEIPADGCHHKDPFHQGTVYVDVTIPITGDTRPWVCHASYFGTLTGVGDDPGPAGCTVEAPRAQPVVALPLTVKERADIDIAYYQDCVDTYTKEAVGFGLATAVPGPQAPLFGAAGAVATATAWQCDEWRKEAEKRKKDPPDEHYTVVAPPAKVVVPTVAGITPALTSAVTALTRNVARSTAVNDALATAINRASTAAKAKNTAAKTLQLKAAGKYSLALAALEQARAGLRKALIAAARASKLNTLTLSPSQLTNASSQPLPKTVLAELAKLHAGSAGVAAFSAALKQGKVPSAPVSLLAGLADGRVAAAEAKDAAALRAYAKSVGVH
jgi:hypothetical protein